MTNTMFRLRLLPLLLIAVSTPAFAADEEAQLWLLETATVELSDSTDLQFEAVQRFRSAAFGGDQYQLRGAIDHDVGSGFVIGAGVVVQRSGTQEEVRLQQQFSYSTGPVAFRTRLEERFQENVGPTVFRLRQRVQVTEGLGGRWTGFANAEGFFTLNESRPGAQTGLTGFRTQIGVRRKLSDTVTVALAYNRQQDVRDNAPDRIGHAPLLSLAFKF